MTKIPCSVIRDLFPSYIEGLTGEETNKVIEEHLQECEECSRILEEMRAPQIKIREEDKKEVDFLKKNRKKNRNIIIGSVVAALALAGFALFCRVFILSEKLPKQSLACDITEENGMFTVTAYSMDSAHIITDMTWKENGDVADITIKGVLSSPFRHGITQKSFKMNDTIKQVRINGSVVWDKGQEISPAASEVYDTAHEYMGDMSKNRRTADVLHVESWLGPFTNELETEKKPYGWRMILKEDIPAKRLEEKEDCMKKIAYVMLGTITNLDYVEYRFTAGNKEETIRFTAEEASEFFGKDIKVCADNAAELDMLMDKLNIRYTEYNYDVARMNAYEVDLVNKSDGPYREAGMLVLTESGTSSSGGMLHADESLIAKDEILNFVMDIEHRDEEVQYLFSITDAEGNVHEVDQSITVRQMKGFVYRVILTGNAQDGYHVVLE